MTCHKFSHGVIYYGDCLELMESIPDGSVDMILADLPYGTTDCHWDSVIPFKPLWEAYNRIAKERAAIVLTASQPFTSALVMSNIKMFKYDYAWNKVAGANFANLKNRPFKTKEDILIFSNVANFTYNPIRVFRTEKSLKKWPINKDKKYIITRKKKNKGPNHYSKGIAPINSKLSNDGKKHPIDIIKFNIVEKGRYYGGYHGTRKPVKLFEYLIKTYTNKGDTVLDNVIGSGTTGIAAYNTGRRFIGMEKDEEIYSMAVNRIDNETRQLKLFENLAN